MTLENTIEGKLRPARAFSGHREQMVCGLPLTPCGSDNSNTHVSKEARSWVNRYPGKPKVKMYRCQISCSYANAYVSA